MEALQAHQLKKHTTKIHVGSRVVKLVQYSYGKGKFFIHVHESETTAKRAALAYIKRHGGKLLTLSHNKERNVSFCLDEKYYAFDPNRIFTPSGIEKTLRAQGNYSIKAEVQVQKLAKAILKRIPQHGKVIAVHNNKEYSMVDYFHKLSKDVRAVHQDKCASMRNFYLVTQEKSFCHLKNKAFNVVWQAQHPEDDGSLSVRLRKRNYVNVEAAYDAYVTQLKMLKYS
ncbi:MAG: hypothetical protein A3F18_06630 [Legionellales bacterium RIFCSPHIGHO2_12_FULL_37_14]|nr:MAG: hypothetical protein A3F18_06630 [Legionellales bacterium RIFCSPHIGHO2_12_FULL_37_14]